MIIILLLASVSVTLAEPLKPPSRIITIEQQPFGEIVTALDAANAEVIGSVADECYRINLDAATADIALFMAKRNHQKLSREMRREFRKRVAASPAYSRACLAATTYMAGYMQTHRYAMDPVTPQFTAQHQ